MTDTPTWAPASSTSGFSAPTSTLHASTPEHRGSKNGSAEGLKKPRRKDPVMIVLSAVAVVLVVLAGVFAWQALTPEDISAPAPASEFERPVDGEAVGPDGVQPVELDDGKQMTVADMAPNSLFIPAIGAYLPVESDATFVDSHYAGFSTLKVPKNPRHGVRYAAGAPMFGGDAGTTMVAAHVSMKTGWGALRYLYSLTGGEMIYTKDDAGQLQTWQLTKMRVENHTDFPQEFWSAEGARQLVVTTCGGTLRNGHYDKNIFAIAVPIDPQPGKDGVSEDRVDDSAAEEIS